MNALISSPQQSKALLAGLPNAPGIYQMLGDEERVLYVGKARNLKKRVASYFQTARLNTRLLTLMQKVLQVQVTVTASETEALLLEQNLIKNIAPTYNILLRDDKSYPGILLTEGDFPRVHMHRSNRRARRRVRGRFFGPYPSGSAVQQSLHFLHKTFKLRQCEDTVFKNRSRPCLQYQINRCSAPCVGYIDKEDYARSVNDVALFLKGDSHILIDELTERMEKASQQQDYEEAVVWRDRIHALRYLQQQQYIEGERGNSDIIAVAVENSDVCVQVLYVRAGRVLGSRSFFPRLSLGENAAAALSAFVATMYLSERGTEIPDKLILSHAPSDREVLRDALAERAGRNIDLLANVRGARARWLKIARTTAEENLSARLSSLGRAHAQVERLATLLGCEEPPKRIECFDISHQGGNETVASCVVFVDGAALNKEYRHFNIKDVVPGDDYAAMRQVLLRRYTRVLEEAKPIPDVILIDGGRGQLKQAQTVCAELGLEGSILLAVAKGPDRKEGEEQLFTPAGLLSWGDDDQPALQMIRRIRDEAHRFAITAHRGIKRKRTQSSILEEVPGLGPRRRHYLYRHFGGIRGLFSASVEDIARVPGISVQLAQEVHSYLASRAKTGKIQHRRTKS